MLRIEGSEGKTSAGRRQGPQTTSQKRVISAAVPAVVLTDSSGSMGLLALSRPAGRVGVVGSPLASLAA